MAMLMMMLIIMLISGQGRGMSYDEKLKKFDKVRIDERNFAKIQNIHINWYTTSIKAVMGQLGKSLFKELDMDERYHLSNCLNKIEERKDLEESAKCLVASRKRHLSKRKFPVEGGDEEDSEEWVGAFRQEDAYRATKRVDFRQILNRQKSQEVNYTKIPRISLLRRQIVNDIKAKRRMKKLRKLKRQKRSSKWTRFGDMDSVLDRTLKVRNVPSAGGLKGIKDKSPVSRIADLISLMAMGNSSVDDLPKNKAVEWKETYDRLLHLKKVFEKKEDSPGARIYSMRMYDIVLDKKAPSMSPKQSRTPQGLMQMAMTLFNQLGGEKNKEMRESMNTNLLSPRFAPVMPDKAKGRDMNLSPTILSFYEDEENKNNIASIPKILKTVGVEGKDRDVMLGALMKASGVNKVINEAMNFLDGINFFGMKDDVFDVTERVAGVYDELEASFNQRQHDSLKSDGFTFMEDHQIDQLYNNDKLNLPDKAKTLNNLKNTTINQKMEALWLTIQQIASGKSQDEQPIRKNITMSGRFSRHKRSLEVPSILEPVILAPFMFAPIFGLSVLGPVILSPSLFSPLILNPSVLGPFILSPAVGIPFILSPYLLSPYILSPLVMAPFILNPYVLSPNVINPYLLSPLVLSPLVLCPDVVSPMALGGAILSPSVASPAVLTETFLMLTVLSPSFMS